MTKIFPTLYKRTSTGAVQEWAIEVEENKYRTTSGQVGGAKTCADWTFVEGKNIGKKNETSPDEQALSEAQSKWQKKLDENYYEDVGDIDKSKFFAPMLAHEFGKKEKKVRYPVFSQPKLDGCRSILSEDGMFSRKGKRFVSCPHIEYALKPIFEKYPNLIFDGESYNHMLKHDFNEIISIVKKTKPTGEDLEKSEKYIEYWVYDVYDKDDPNLGFQERFALLSMVLQGLPPFIRITPAHFCENREELDEAYDTYLLDGYEGQMVRSVNGLYENKRSNNLLKRKEFVDEEFNIVDIIEGKGNLAGLAASIEFEYHNGEKFSATPIGNHIYCQDLLEKKDRYIGKPATVRYQNLTPDRGVPRFAKMKILRNYE